MSSPRRRKAVTIGVAILLALIVAGLATWAVLRPRAGVDDGGGEVAEAQVGREPGSADASDGTATNERRRVTIPDVGEAGAANAEDHDPVHDRQADADAPSRPAAAPEDGPPAPPTDGLVALVRAVTAADGSPLVGATLEVRDWYDVIDGPRLGGESPYVTPLHTAVADDAGWLGVPAIDGLDPPVLTLRASGHVTQSWRADPDTAGAVPRNELALAESGAIVGQVWFAHGPTAGGATVVAIERRALQVAEHPDTMAAVRDLLWGSGRYDDDLTYRWVATVCDETGRYAIEGLRRDREYVVAAFSRDGDSRVSPAVLPGGPTEGIDLQIEPLVTVTLSLRAEEGGPIEIDYANVAATPRTRLHRAKDVRVGPGRFRFEGLAPGHQILEIETDTHGEIEKRFEVPRGVAQHAVAVVIPTGNTISATLRTRGGHPIPGAWVTIMVREQRTSELASVRLATDTHGRVSVASQPDGLVTIYSGADGFLTRKLDRLRQPVHDLEIVLLAARLMTIELQPANGVAIVNLVNVAVRPLGTPDDPAPGEWVEYPGHWERGEPLELEQMPLGRTLLRIWSPGAALFEREVTVARDGPGSLEAARLVPAETVRVRVVDEAGRPLPGALVFAEYGDLPPVDWVDMQRAADSDGLAVVEVHRPGPISVEISAADREDVTRLLGEREALREPVPVTAGPRY